MYYESYGKEERARELYGEIPRELLEVPEDALRAASKACPQGIDIASRLGEARRLLA